MSHGDDDYRSDYKTSDPNWYVGFNPNIKSDRQGVQVKIKQLHPGAKPPAYKTPGAAGMDLHSCEKLLIGVGDHAVVRTGIALAIPEGYVGLVCPRSGLAADFAVTVLNSPGVIDDDYRGELKVILINHGRNEYRIAPGDRIAQLVIEPVFRAQLQVVQDLDDTDRGTGGFGSTGR